jgi:carboxynorspermidine decarboxylase
VIEMPYRPPLMDAGDPGEKPYLIRLGGPTCLAGDVVGDYSFASPLTEGQRLIFGDMAIYTTCKNNTFNGMPLPPIWLLGADGNCRELVHFGYQDFKMRLGAQKIKSVCHGLRAATNAFFMKGDVKVNGR